MMNFMLKQELTSIAVIILKGVKFAIVGLIGTAVTIAFIQAIKAIF